MRTGWTWAFCSARTAICLAVSVQFSDCRGSATRLRGTWYRRRGPAAASWWRWSGGARAPPRGLPDDQEELDRRGPRVDGAVRGRRPHLSCDHRDLQARLRSGVCDHELDAVLDEILRTDDPFVTNRRVTTRAVTIGGRQIGAGEQVFLNWTSANRDPRTFGDPDQFDSLTHRQGQPGAGTRQARVPRQATRDPGAAGVDPPRPRHEDGDRAGLGSSSGAVHTPRRRVRPRTAPPALTFPRRPAAGRGALNPRPLTRSRPGEHLCHLRGGAHARRALCL